MFKYFVLFSNCFALFFVLIHRFIGAFKESGKLKILTDCLCRAAYRHPADKAVILWQGQIIFYAFNHILSDAVIRIRQQYKKFISAQTENKILLSYTDKQSLTACLNIRISGNVAVLVINLII